MVGRKELAKINSKAENSGEDKGSGEEGGRGRSSLSRGLSTVWNFMTALTRDYVTGPPTDIRNCLNAFFDVSELKGMQVIVGLFLIWSACLVHV